MRGDKEVLKFGFVVARIFTLIIPMYLAYVLHTMGKGNVLYMWAQLITVTVIMVLYLPLWYFWWKGIDKLEKWMGVEE